jgi:hypothetical protein
MNVADFVNKNGAIQLKDLENHVLLKKLEPNSEAKV